MLYSTLFVATAAFSGLVAAQNGSVSGLPSTIEPCCTVDANLVSDDLKTEWCQAQENTCPEICGGQGQIASGGNECDEDTLEFTCKCRNGTVPTMSDYQQSVPGQMCRFWYGRCINQTNQIASQQFACDQTRNQECGNQTTKDESETSSSSSASSRPTSTSGSDSSSGSPTSSGTAESSTSSPGAAVRLAREFGAPVVAGGLIAFFGIAL
ncbi:hypothetical protein N0V90_003261 [Kalmusia sp. IMI 367209]|nr:hypothetical protein N0V90_003261 [Kalmusia sp. IMI 367209]